MSERGARVEPHADIRAAAVIHMQLYIAYLDAGFSPEQALQLVIAVVRINQETQHG